MSWLLLNKTGLFLVEGSSYISFRAYDGNKLNIPKEWFTGTSPGSMVVDTKAPDPPQSADKILAPQPHVERRIDSSSGISSYTTGRSHLTLTPLGTKDNKGFKQFALKLFNDKSLAVDSLVVISGSPVAQGRSFVHPAKDYAGSGNPICEGVYQIGKVIKMSSPEKGVGYTKIPINIVSAFDLNNRSEFLFHDDYNRSVAVGSLGCIVTYSSKDMSKIIEWCGQKSRPNYLIVNYGLGVIK